MSEEEAFAPNREVRLELKAQIGQPPERRVAGMLASGEAKIQSLSASRVFDREGGLVANPRQFPSRSDAASWLVRPRARPCAPFPRQGACWSSTATRVKRGATRTCQSGQSGG